MLALARDFAARPITSVSVGRSVGGPEETFEERHFLKQHNIETRKIGIKLIKESRRDN